MFQLVRIKSIVASLLWKVFPNIMAKRQIEKMKKGNHITIHGGYDFMPHILENCEFFLSKEQLADKKYMDGIIIDIVKSYSLYGTNANEYFCYKFPQRNHRERSTYLPRRKKDLLLIEQMHGQFQYYFGQIKDKNVFYEMAKSFFGRDACKIESMDDFKPFTSFENENNKESNSFNKSHKKKKKHFVFTAIKDINKKNDEKNKNKEKKDNINDKK